MKPWQLMRRFPASAAPGGGSLPPAFASHSSAAAGTYSTTTSFADYLVASITTSAGANLLIRVDLCGYGDKSNFMVEIVVDGVTIASSQTTVNGSGWGFTLPVQAIAAVAAGAHTVKARVKSSSGSHNLGAPYYSALTVKEF